MTNLKSEVLKEIDSWPVEDGLAIYFDGKLVYDRPCLEPFKDPQGRLLCVGHVVAYEG